jgi:demethylmenaquinone methyltransferase / 2-methoxy-6-polyprenyl-1,4-benzoquinol methylase
MSFRLPTAEEKSEYVLKQFDRIAWNYDLTNDAISLGMHRLWKNAAIASLEPRLNGSYLDVCCGTGDLASGIAQRLSQGGRVVGVDFSQNMLDLAAKRNGAPHEGRDRGVTLEWLRADAENLPFADNSFDGAMISFGLRNLTNLQKGVLEMARVVKPGGKVVNLDLGHPSAPIFTPLYHFYFRNIVPLLGELLAGDRSAYTYLPSSLSSYPKPDGITAMFAAAQLKNIVHKPLAWGSVALHVGTVA